MNFSVDSRTVSYRPITF